MLEKKEVSASAIVSGDFEMAKFGALMGPKMFKTVIADLYSNKPQSIMRELCTNAYDAQIEKGNADRPIEVRLPTFFDSTFAVRDFGNAMSHEQIMSHYITLFKSTKDQDNLAVGKYGLGSKSPFSYTEQFAIISRQSGVKRTYSAYRTSDWEPHCVFIGSEETDEEDGLEVTFPVRDADINLFQQAFVNVALGFPVRPHCEIQIFNDKLDQMVEHLIINQDGIQIFSKRVGNLAQWNVRMGCVIYPIDFAPLLLPHWGNLGMNPSCIVLNIPIGSINITPSREAIDYDTETILFMKNLLETAGERVSEIIFSKIKANEFKTPYELTKKLNEFSFMRETAQYLEEGTRLLSRRQKRMVSAGNDIRSLAESVLRDNRSWFEGSKFLLTYDHDFLVNGMKSCFIIDTYDVLTIVDLIKKAVEGKGLLNIILAPRNEPTVKGEFSDSRTMSLARITNKATQIMNVEEVQRAIILTYRDNYDPQRNSLYRRQIEVIDGIYRVYYGEEYDKYVHVFDMNDEKYNSLTYSPKKRNAIEVKEKIDTEKQYSCFTPDIPDESLVSSSWLHSIETKEKILLKAKEGYKIVFLRRLSDCGAAYFWSFGDPLNAMESIAIYLFRTGIQNPVDYKKVIVISTPINELEQVKQEFPDIISAEKFFAPMIKMFYEKCLTGILHINLLPYSETWVKRLTRSDGVRSFMFKRRVRDKMTYEHAVRKDLSAFNNLIDSTIGLPPIFGKTLNKIKPQLEEILKIASLWKVNRNVPNGGKYSSVCRIMDSKLPKNGKEKILRNMLAKTELMKSVEFFAPELKFKLKEYKIPEFYTQLEKFNEEQQSLANKLSSIS